MGTKKLKAAQIALASAGGLAALMGNVGFVKDGGVTFGKSVEVGFSQAAAQSCSKDSEGNVICGCSEGCGVR